ncbi:MAG: hypothetical protein ABFD08_00750 [Syntrophomonas sp.]
MVNLDFAFFNLKNEELQGLIGRKFFLDRLAPIFFAPRIEKLIDLYDLDACGCNIMLPLGPGNLSMLQPEKQEDIAHKSTAIVEDCKLAGMAVDRRHKRQFLKLFNNFPLIFGDNFIKALASVLVRETLSRRDIKKLVIVGETEYFPDFINEVGSLGIPVSLQNYNPRPLEVLARRLLYEKGQAVSTSCINPENWEKGDMVLMFDPDGWQMAISSPQAFCIKLSNEACNLSRDLEVNLRRNGIEWALHNLAPILEISLLSKAGIWAPGAEHNNAGNDESRRFLDVQELGYKAGLWDLFLDKAI